MVSLWCAALPLIYYIILYSLVVSHGSFISSLLCAIEITLCRKCQGLASFPQPSLAALLFFSSVSPLRPTPLYLSEERKTLSQHARPWCLLHIFQQQGLHLRSKFESFFETSRRPQMCTPALDQRLLWSSWAGEATAELSISQPTFLGVGRKQECCSVSTWVFFIFSLFSTLYHDSCLSLLLLLWQSSVRNSLSLCTSQNQGCRLVWRETTGSQDCLKQCVSLLSLGTLLHSDLGKRAK